MTWRETNALLERYIAAGLCRTDAWRIVDPHPGMRGELSEEGKRLFAALPADLRHRPTTIVYSNAFHNGTTRPVPAASPRALASASTGGLPQRCRCGGAVTATTKSKAFGRCGKCGSVYEGSGRLFAGPAF